MKKITQRDFDKITQRDFEKITQRNFEKITLTLLQNFRKCVIMEIAKQNGQKKEVFF